MIKQANENLPMPVFEKVRYGPWQLEKMQPSQSIAASEDFQEDFLGLKVTGSTTTHQQLSPDLVAAGVLLMNIKQAYQEYPELVKNMVGTVIGRHSDRLAANNYDQFNTGFFLYIPANVQIEPVVQVVLNQIADGQGDLIARILVYVGENSQVKLLQRLQTLGNQASKASVVVEVLAQRGSRLTYANIDDFGPHTSAYINRQADVLANAQVDWVNASFNDGNTITRLASHVDGEGSISHAKVAAFTNRKQVQGFITEIQNSGRHSLGHIFQRGVILNSSALVFNGIGRIIKGAKGSDAQQESRVLMLSRRGRGEANPLLLIDENDVTAGHAASVGRVDEQQLYYLMSRGLPEKVARKLVIRGFIGEVLSQMPTNQAQQDLIDAIERKLQYERA